MKQATEVDLPALVERHEHLIVNCRADWCYPFKLHSKAFKKLETQGILEDVEVVKLDVGVKKPEDVSNRKNRCFAMNTYETNKIPTLAFYKKGALLKVIKKYNKAGELKKILQSLYR